MLVPLSPKKRMNRQMSVDVCTLDANRMSIRFGKLTTEQWKLDEKKHAMLYTDTKSPGVLFLQFSESVNPDGEGWRKIVRPRRYDYGEISCSEVFHQFNPKHGRYRMFREMKTDIIKIYITNGYVGPVKTGAINKRKYVRHKKEEDES
jgi:hypothetical protein